MKEDKKLLEKVKKLMITKYPRFAQEIASANLEYKTDLPSKTAATDGKNIYFDPNFLQNLSDNDKLFIVAHELMHIKFEHMFRMTDKNGEKRNLKYWNIATDAIINANLERDGFKIMEGAVNMPEALNYSAEEFYEKLLKKEKQKQSSGGQNGQNQQSQNQNNKNSEQNGQGQNKDKQNNQSENQSNEKNTNTDNQNKQTEQNGQNSDNKQSDSQLENNQKDGDDSGKNEQHENNNQEQNQSTEQDNNNNNQNNSKSSGDGQKQNSQELDDEFADDHSLWEKAFEESRQGNKEQKENKQNNLDKQENKQNENSDNDQNQEKKQPQNKDKNKNQSEKDNEEKQDSLKNEQNDQKNLDSNKNEVEFDEVKLNEKSEFEQNRQERKERAKQKFEKMKDQELKKTDDSNLNLGEIGEAKAILDWKLLLRREFDKTETIWSQRRSIAENNYAYRLEEYDVEDEAETEVMIDVSGSVSNSLVRAFLRQLKPILKSSKVKVGFFADYATSQKQFQEIKNDRDINNLKIYRPGEGTNMDAAVKAFSKRPEVNKIVFTDGYAGRMPSKETKDINVFWLVYGDETYNPCCGKVFQISEKDFESLSLLNKKDYFENDRTL